MPFHTQTSATAPTSRLGGAGLDLITSSTFSAASSVTVENCFSDSFSFYRIVFTATNAATAVIDMNMRWRVSGADESSAVYSNSLMYQSNSAGPTRAVLTSQTSFYPFAHGDNGSLCVMDISGVEKPEATHTSSISSGNGSVASQWSASFSRCSTSTVYTGFTITPYSGTSTGSLAVFGYRKA